MAAEISSPASGLLRSQAAPPLPERQAGVYEHLIGAEEDVVGLVAYALYKQEKRDWLDSWRAQNNAEPGPEHFSAFVSANLTQGQRQRYRSAARQVLESYLSTTYDGMPAAGSEERAAERIEAAVHRLEGGGGWMQSVAAGAAAGVVVVALLAILTFLVRLDLFGIFSS